MTKKLIYEFVKERFEKEGYKLLSKKYLGVHDKLKFKCCNNHIHYISFNKWNKGQRCGLCYIKSRKYDINKIRTGFNKEGYILLSTDCLSKDTKIEYICPNGHKNSVTWYNWVAGHRCRACFFNYLRIPKFKIIKAILDEGYELLDIIPENYNSRTKFKVKCVNGHEFVTNWNKWQSGYRCKVCGYEFLAGSYKHDYFYIKNSIEKENYKLLSTEYKNAKVKLAVICPYGHKYSVNWNDWKSGYRCKKCSIINNSGFKHPNWRGGISFEPYCSVWKDAEYKQNIKERDNYNCLNPYCSSTNPSDLTIHHIDYNKKNCGPQNLITLCRSCNAKANKDRKWHTAWFRAVMYRRYKYKY